MKSPFPYMGSKSSYLKEIKFPETFETYYEPFLGSGAIFCHLEPKNAVISDINPFIIDVFKNLRTGINVNELQNVKNSRGLFDLRKKEFNEHYENIPYFSFLFIYLIRYSFGNMFNNTPNPKVHFSNTFNPQREKKMINNFPERLNTITHFLNKNNILILNQDYKKVLENCKENDFVVLDPPYISADPKVYVKNSFDNEEFLDVIRILMKRKCKVLVFNYYNEKFIDSLLDLNFKLFEMKKTSNINKISHQNKRQIFMTNYKNQ